jgi:hypothetical protein
MKEVAKILGVKMGEKFKVNGNIFRFDGGGLVDDDDNSYPNTMKSLLTGEFSIEKLPWKPHEGDIYWFRGAGDDVISSNWNNNNIDYSFYYVGNCFATREEALKHAPEIIKKLKSFYENEGADK